MWANFCFWVRVQASWCDADRQVWAVCATTENFLATAEGTSGRLFPEATPNGGTLLGVPLMVTDRLPAGRITLIDASGFAVNTGTIDLDRSQAAALQLDREHVPESGETSLVSMFQTNATAMRIIAAYACERIRTGSVAVWEPRA